MKMNKVIKHKLPATHEEWLDNRLKGIGGSDAGSVLGMNKYKSAYALWCEKTGRIHKNIDNERMRFGRDMEDYVAKRWEEMSKEWILISICGASIHVGQRGQIGCW